MNDVLKYAELFRSAVTKATLEVEKSPIHGVGVFSLTQIDAGDVFFSSVLDSNPEFKGFNHADTPNAKMMSHHPHHGTKLLAIKDINPGDEVTVRYPDTSAFEMEGQIDW